MERVSVAVVGDRLMIPSWQARVVGLSGNLKLCVARLIHHGYLLGSVLEIFAFALPESPGFMLNNAPPIKDANGEELYELSLSGLSLLDCPVFNKGSAFSNEERTEFGLHGLLPPHVGTIDEQLDRRYRDFSERRTELQQHVYLRDLQDRNEVLFYRLMAEHIAEMMPLIYTPVVGEACRHFSRIYRRPRGLFLSAERRDELETILDNRPFREVDVIVVTDGERILGLGDLGIGGMGIPVGKLSLYTLCGGIDPSRTLPITLDVGTDNPEALADPLYLGWRHPRLRGQEYDDFIEAFVQAVQKTLPDAILQWEDFALPNARKLLDRYRDRICSFNDDIQGTSAVAVSAVIAAGEVASIPLTEQRVVILGAGSAGSGIADGIVAAMVAEGLTEPLALRRIWLVDRPGLLLESTPGLQDFQKRFARPMGDIEGWNLGLEGKPGLAEVVENVHPSTLIGASGQTGAFVEGVIRAMARHVDRPTILPLSNPTSKSEARPADLFEWTDGKALVATGSPFEVVHWNGRTIRISQCNNAYIFPGLGMGLVASRANRVADTMFLGAARSLADASPARSNSDAGLFPPWSQIESVSKAIALSVGLEAVRLGLAEPMLADQHARRIENRWWRPEYRRMQRAH
jgi:malate dehydrogenase (oxaloacetate-decarboxylating)